MTEALTAAAVVFVAELGDRSQLVVVTQAGTAHLVRTLAALLGAIGLLQGVAAVIGGAVGAALPDAAVGYGSGALFLAFAVIAWRQAPDEDDPEPPPASLTQLVGMFVLAELGDKTNLATASLAATSDPLAVWVGATLGMFLATVAALAAGRWLRHAIGARRLLRLGAAAFAVVGGVTVVATAAAT